MNTKAKSELKDALPLIGSLFPFLIGVIISLSIPPENCSLFGNPTGPFVCDTFPTPVDCCVEMKRVFQAQIIFGFGAVVTVGAFVAFSIFLMKNSQDHSDSLPKIFD